MNKFESVLITALLGTLGTAAYAEGDAVKADNSKVNAVREDAGLPNAESQSDARKDVELAASIRKAIVSHDELSTYAHNVKIVVKDQKVQLIGPVRSAEEKAAVEQIAQGRAGAVPVKSELQVVPE